MIAAVILAAGASTRMGRHKVVLEVGGEAIVHRVASEALAAGLHPVIVVVGHEADATREALAGLDVQVVANPRYASGINTSLDSGVGAVPEGADGVVVLLADMPRVTAAMIRRLVDAFRQSDTVIVASSYDGVHAPPTLYDRSLFAELRGGEGEGRGREVVKRNSERTLRVDQPPAALGDVDLPADMDRLRSEVDALPNEE